MENTCIVTKLKSQVDLENPCKIGEYKLVIKAGSGLDIGADSTTTIVYKALDGTFSDGTVEKSSNGWTKLIAPENLDITVSISNKYHIYAIAHLNDSFTDYTKLEFNDKMFDFWGVDVNPSALLSTVWFGRYNADTLNYMTNIYANHNSFGYCPIFAVFGNWANPIRMYDFDFESVDNGLDSRNLPNLKTIGFYPLVEVDIVNFGRLTNVDNFHFSSTPRYVGSINDLGEELLKNGKTNNFQVITNVVITLDGHTLPYLSKVNAIYDNGQYIYLIQD